MRQELARLWVKSQPAISAYIRSFVTDVHVSQDLVQEVAEAAALHFQKYDRTKPFLTWTMSIARRRVMRYFRDQARDKLVFTTESMEAVAQGFERAAPLADARKEAISDCIAGLKGRTRLVLKMRYFSDLKPQSIADELDLSGDTVRSLLVRARKSIASCVRKRLAIGGNGE